MNSLKEKISKDMIQAMKSGDASKRMILGMLKSAIGNKEIEKRKKEEGLNESETQEVIRSEVKKRIDASEAFKTAGDSERSAAELAEAEILKIYLPPEASNEEVKAACEKAIAEAGSKAKKDFGRIMGLAVKSLGGRADGNRIKQVLEGMLE